MMRISLFRTAMLAATLVAGTVDAQEADPFRLLAPARIAALPAAERQAWERYVETSRRQMAIAPNVVSPDQRRFLVLANRTRADARFLRGLDGLLLAQFPNGCWPLAYPLIGGTVDAAWFGDDATVEVLRLLRDAARGDDTFVGDERRQRARASLERGIRCVLDSQVVVDGRRTGWSGLHDPLTLAPFGLRGDPGLAAAATAEVLGFLMEQDSDDPRVAVAVHGGAAWLRETMLWGLAYAPRTEPVPTPGAGPFWARDYETGWNRPLFQLGGGEAVNDWRRVPAGGWTQDGWLTDAPARVLAHYDAWVAARATTVSAPVPARPNVMVDARHGGADGQVVGGMPIYRSIGAAVAAAPADGRGTFVIAIRNGRYREKLSIDKPNIHLVGESRDGTVLTYDVAAGHRSPGGWQYGTRGSWTLRVAAPGFRLERMTVENAFDFMGNAAKAEGDTTKITGTQAVAVMLDSGSDRAVFRDCRLAGHQDTLFPNAGRAYVQRCEILGSVDFIFGAGRAVFDDCDIVSRDRGSATNNGYITAPSTPVSQPYGFLFLGGRLRKETPGMAPNSVTLGRPWHPSGRPDAIGSAVFINVWMDAHVGATGWSPMNSTDAAGHRVENRPEDARFFEFGSTGPGAVASPSRRVLTPEQAAEFTILHVLDGWDPRQ
jgi:pectinesterase